ncbi:MAG: hypothetical protein ACE5KT_12035, partial [Methanosarcinales archaeon]
LRIMNTISKKLERESLNILAKYVYERIRPSVKVESKEQLKEFEKRLRDCKRIENLLKEANPREVALRVLENSYKHFTHHGIRESWRHIIDDKYRYDIIDILYVKNHGVWKGHNEIDELNAIIGKSGSGRQIVVFTAPDGRIVSSRACDERCIRKIERNFKK